ncbi:AAA family ATPase [Actinomadura monticuli]|uniref:AAA family ATPase n=1 Tax=Actinomadura monticuli TaxID=3097367 RepID=A0ABV4Q8C5_9ACTN
MTFAVLPAGTRSELQEFPPGFYLITDNWDDWFTYKTQYDLAYRNPDGNVMHIGQIKIGQFSMRKEQERPEIPEIFDKLDNRFFSLGQDDSYYQSLNSLGEETRDTVLRALRDVALDQNLFRRCLREEVTGMSLLRSVPKAMVEGQLRRLAQGGTRLSEYHFTYTSATGDAYGEEPITLEFDVIPDSQPPTNIHVLIGRNGVGKTHILHHMALAWAGDRSEGDVGEFNILGDGGFVNLVSVTFSAFDPFEPISTPRNKVDSIQYAYIGLKTIKRAGEKGPKPPKDWRALAKEFSESVKSCLRGARLVRWRRALEMLEADPIFNDAGVADLADATADDDELRKQATLLFRRLSSGHKIVLLTITRLVETVEERSLVLLDEPEAHLHPPLLSAFARALSNLLIDRNGVAIIATHSPVILQEVPRSCAWKLRRSGREIVAERPGLETFGENVGILTREIFGLELTRSGFHRILGELVSDGCAYEDILARFSDQLGGEARALVRALIAARDVENEI